jgi:hypothetical protein
MLYGGLFASQIKFAQAQADTEDGDSDIECDFYIPGAKPPVGPIRNFNNPVRSLQASVLRPGLFKPSRNLRSLQMP